jgi:hypothetical protein
LPREIGRKPGECGLLEVNEKECFKERILRSGVLKTIREGKEVENAP